MRIFITSNYPEKYIEETENICRIVDSIGHKAFCFAREYPKFDDNKVMMALAKKDVLSCDALILDVTDGGSTGRLLECGIAYAGGKKVVIIAKEGTDISPTLEGVSDKIIFYNKIDNILEPLEVFVQTV